MKKRNPKRNPKGRNTAAQTASSVRIIAGDQRGRRLQFVDYNGDLRPCGDRMRETLFSWLQFELPGMRVLDLFAGTGVLAAEALSRGAKEAVVIEKQRERSALVSTQMKELFADRAQVFCADALDWLQQNLVDQHFDLVFVDPPYHLELAEPVCAYLHSEQYLSSNAWIYVETGTNHAAPSVPSSWILKKEKQSGAVRAQLFQKT